MSQHAFRIVNVFTRRGESLTGNPLCVFENASDFDARTMQALARQFNLSETTFILPSDTADARVRIFTPNYEMAFAGHPTLGTAQVCRALGLAGNSLTLELAAGLIPVVADGDRWTLTAPTATWRELDVSIAALAEALGLEVQDIGERPLWVKAGKEQLIIPLATLEAVQRTAPRPALFAKILSEDHVGMAYVFASTGASTTEARFFFSAGMAMLEDPATGSATANFGAWCIAMQRPLPLRYGISQGAMIERPSLLHLSVDAQSRIQVGGEVIDIARGFVNLN